MIPATTPTIEPAKDQAKVFEIGKQYPFDLPVPKSPAEPGE